MDVNITRTSNRLIARPSGPRLDSPNALSFKENLRATVEQADMDVVVDMRDVDFMDSSGLGALVATSRLIPSPHEMMFANLQPIVARVFDLTHLNRVFTILPDGELV